MGKAITVIRRFMMLRIIRIPMRRGHCFAIPCGYYSITQKGKKARSALFSVKKGGRNCGLLLSETMDKRFSSYFLSFFIMVGFFGRFFLTEKPKEPIFLPSAKYSPWE